MFGDLNDPNSEVPSPCSNAKSVTRLDYEKDGTDTDPNIYYLNLAETEAILSSDQFGQVPQAICRVTRITPLLKRAGKR